MSDRQPTVGDAESGGASDHVVTEERPHPLTPIVQIWVWLVGFGLFAVRQVAENPGGLTSPDLTRFPWWLLIVGAVFAVSIVHNLWVWWTTRFVATASELRVEHRGVQHESRRIAYQRIQAVDITQRFAARLLGMAELTVDVGGDRPIRLQYLSRARAVELRDYLLSRAHGSEPDAPGVASAWDDTGTHDRVLLRLPPAELILGAVLSHELIALIAVAAIPLALGIALGQPLLVGGGIVPILLSIGGFVSKRVIGQFNYTLADTPGGLRITRGLTSLTSETIPVHRIQAIRLHEPVLWRLVGRTRVDLSYLGMNKLTTNEDGVGASSIMLPIGRTPDVRTAVHAVWPALDLDAIALRGAPRAARWLAPLGWPFLGYGFDDRVLLIRRGWWTRTTWVLPHARLQSVQVSSGPLRRALGVASLDVHTTELGGVASAYLDAASAPRFALDELERARASRGVDRLRTPLPTDATSR